MTSLLRPIFARRSMKSSIETFLRVKSNGFAKNWAGYKREQSTASWSASQTGWSDSSLPLSVLKRERVSTTSSLPMSVQCTWKTMRSCRFGANGNRQRWKAAPNIRTRFMSGQGFRRGEPLKCWYSPATWMLSFTRSIFLRGHCFPLFVKNSPMATVSSRIMTQSTRAGWRRSLWSGKVSTGGKHHQRALTSTQ